MALTTLTILTLLVPFVVCSPVVRQTVQNDLHPALLNLGATWPVPGVPRTNISSTFGPRILVSGNRYDFHRGVDISAGTGTEIVSILDGTLYGTITYSGGGRTVRIDHPVNVRFHGQDRTRMTTFYMHMDSYHPTIASGTRGMGISAGQVIGYVGQTGSAVTPHLHIEARVGGRCSLEFQLRENRCVVGYDPHVHPLYLFAEPGAGDGLSVSTTQTAGGAQDGVVRVSAPDAFPVANRYELVSVAGGGAETTLHVLDLTLREGFDASTTARLDTQNTDDPYLEPLSFGQSATTWEMDYVVPAGYRTKAAGETWKAVVENVFEERFEVEVAPATASW